MSDRLTSVAIVIPVHNRRETTLQGLRSLSRVTHPNIEIHTIIVDDGSTDGTADAIRSEFPEVEIITGDGTLHYAAGTNRGVEAALKRNIDFIVTGNDDSIFHEQFLSRLLNTAKNNPRTVIGAMLLLWDQPYKPFQVDFKWRTFAGGWIEPLTKTVFDFPRDVFEVEGLAGNCVLIPVGAFRECGLMDEKKFPHGWGDAQLFARMRKMEWRLMIEPKAYVWCEPNTNPPPLHTLSLGEVLNILFTNEKHPLNLKRQFVARWESAPSKLKAFVAFCIYLTSLAGKSLKFGAKR